MNTIRHGELILKPVTTIPDDVIWEKKHNHIAGFSQANHHHVILGQSFVWKHLVKITIPTKIEHQKTQDKHTTLDIPIGVYEVIKKTEYDPFMQVIRDIWD